MLLKLTCGEIHEFKGETIKDLEMINMPSPIRRNMPAIKLMYNP